MTEIVKAVHEFAHQTKNKSHRVIRSHLNDFASHQSQLTEVKFLDLDKRDNIHSQIRRKKKIQSIEIAISFNRYTTANNFDGRLYKSPRKRTFELNKLGTVQSWRGVLPGNQETTFTAPWIRPYLQFPAGPPPPSTQLLKTLLRMAPIWRPNACVTPEEMNPGACPRSNKRKQIKKPHAT